MSKTWDKLQSKVGLGPADTQSTINTKEWDKKIDRPVDIDAISNEDFIAKVHEMHSDSCKIQYNMMQWEIKGGGDLSQEDVRQRYLNCVVGQLCPSAKSTDRHNSDRSRAVAESRDIRVNVLSLPDVQECLHKIHDRALQLKEQIHDESHPKYQDLTFLAYETENATPEGESLKVKPHDKGLETDYKRQLFNETREQAEKIMRKP